MTMGFIQNFFLTSSAVIVLLVAIFLASCYQNLWLLVENSPSRLKEINAIGDYSIKFSDRIRNCEDGLMIEEDRVGILSCDPGRDLWNTVLGTRSSDLSTVPSGELVLYRYDSSRFKDDEAIIPIELRDFPDVREFHPLGIDYHRPSSSLFVCNHHYNRSRVDIFSLDLDSSTPIARHQRTLISPLVKAPNSVTALNGHEFYVSNDHYFPIFENKFLNLIETYGQLPLSSIAYVNLAAGDQSAEIRSVAHVPFANGITLLNATTLAVASSSTFSVRLFEILPDRSLQEAATIKLPFPPDNLSTDKEGSLLIAGHPHPPTLSSLVKNRFECVTSSSQKQSDCYDGMSPSGVAEWSADKGLRILYIAAKDGFASSTTAVRDTDYNLGFVTGLYQKGLLVWNF